MTEREQIEQAIAALESQRVTLGDAVVDTMMAAAREKLNALDRAQDIPQRKQITVLFADVSGFMAMAETMDVEEVGDIINALWTRLDGVITAYGGTIDKHIGDGVMALFGAPTAREDDPQRAIRAALAIQQEVKALQTEETHPPMHKLARSLGVRIGINTGPVLLGPVGTTSEYTAMGDVVNLAGRLEKAAPVGGILIAHDTYRHVRGIFNMQALEPIRVKGKAEPVQAYLVRSVKPRAFRVPARGVEGVETRMIGRDAELECLQKALYTVMEERKTRVVTIVGDAGIGKSRLLYEFENWVELLPESVLYFKGRASQRTRDLPYFLIRDLFSFRFEIKNSDPVTVAREKLGQGIVRFMGADAADVDARMKAHFIGHLIGLDFSESPYLRGILNDARQIRDRAFHYAAQFFAAATASPPPAGGTDRGRPAALLLEDLHWADDGSLDLIEHLARANRHSPLLIVALTRPELFEQRATWGNGEAVHTRLELCPLSRQDSRRLVEEILRQVEQTPPDLHDLIVDGAEGNPFFIEEMIKMLIEEDVIVKGKEQWCVELERLAEVRVPPTLTGVLQARLDALPPLERETLQRAAVVGRVFWDGAVGRLNGDAGAREGKTARALAVLQSKELIFKRETSAFVREGEYVFKHAILHEVTYESVLKRRRRAYHAQVAAWLVAQSGERVTEHAGLIGEHYERAGERSSAAEWYARAGRQAQATYAPEAAIGHYQKALALLPTLASSPSTSSGCFRKAEPAETLEAGDPHAMQRVKLYRGLGLMLRWQTRFEEAAQAYVAMRAAGEKAGDKVAQAHAWEGLSKVQQAQGDYRAALESAARAEEIARAAGAPAQVALARALYNKGWVLSNLGEVDAASSLGERALALSIGLGAQRIMADSLNLLGWVHQTLGRYDPATRYFEQALGVFRELDDRVWVGGMLNNLGVIAEAREDYPAAAALYQEALTIAREIGHRHAEIVVFSNLGGARVGLGEYEAAEADLLEAIEMAEAVGWGGLAETYRFLAQARLGQGRATEALEAARRALELGQGTGLQEDIGEAWRVLGMVLTAAPSPGSITVGEDTLDAAACFARSLEIFTETGMEGEQARTLRAWARYEMERGDRDRGERMWQEAREVFARLGIELGKERPH
jgi:predicted ATPase/class 3 adenylate cyclase